MTHARTLAGFAPFIIPLLLGGCVVKTEVNHSAQGCGPDAISCDDGLACTADVCLAPDELVDSYRCANTVLATACVIDSACHVADNCGVCDADLSNDCVADCAGDWGGEAVADACGECDNDISNDNTTCVQDCAGAWGGGAMEDDCGVCDYDEENDNLLCEQDCAGVWGGDAASDDCGVCDSDASNDNTTCVKDCAGDWGGLASQDDCGVCDFDASNNNSSCVKDCADVWGGDAALDGCGVCDYDPSNDNTLCAQDCALVWGGSAYIDDCGVCDDDASNDNASCVQDCDGEWDGPATSDDCGVCDVDASNDNTTCVQDCADVWGGDAELDCEGVCDGGATRDDCGICDHDISNDNTTCSRCAMGEIFADNCWPILPTGITSCFNDTMEIDCAMLGQPDAAQCENTPWCGQDGQYADELDSQFVCYNVNGEALSECPPTLSSGETVFDPLTRLTWQRSDMPTMMRWGDAGDYCADLDYAGITDWRLPNRHELRSITDISMDTPRVSMAVFPGTMSLYYWTSSTFAGDAAQGWVIDFEGAYVLLSDKSKYHFVRCVR